MTDFANRVVTLEQAAFLTVRDGLAEYDDLTLDQRALMVEAIVGRQLARVLMSHQPDAAKVFGAAARIVALATDLAAAAAEGDQAESLESMPVTSSRVS